MYFSVLDLLRFFSSVTVLFHHTFLFHYGRLSIYLFFMISGFVIYFSLNKGIKEYVVGRFLRLFPIFWVCATITFLITLYYGTSISFKNYLIGLLMINSGRMETMIDGSYWTLTFELLFYAYIGIFVWIFTKKYIEWFFIGWLAICFFSFYFHLDQLFIVKLLCVRFVPYFVFGGMLALYIDRAKTIDLKTKFMYISVMLAAAVMPIYVSSSLIAQKDSITNFTGSFTFDELVIVEALFVVMLLGVLLSYTAIAKNKTFTKIAFLLGGITYPLYLLHWKIGDTIISHYGYDYGTVSYFSVFVAGAIVVVAYVLSVYDVTFRNYCKKKIQKYL